MVNLTYNYTFFWVLFPIFCRFPRKSGGDCPFCRFLKNPGEISALGTFGVVCSFKTPTPPYALSRRGYILISNIKIKKKKKKKENKIKKKKSATEAALQNQAESVPTLFSLYSFQLFGDYSAFFVDKIAEMIIRRTAPVVDF